MLTDALNEMKRKSGKTLSQISEECNIPKGTLNKVFAGQTRDPQYGTLRTIVHALGYTLDDLETFENPDEKKSPAPAKAETGEVTREMSIQLLKALGLLDKSGNLSDDDLAFLGYIVGLLEWRFGDHS
jgi:transcriptional regulator with XRE-family HTH domain|nr:MAG TPA: helix-turn-helix domain protein [Caudoviricetes sp.]